MISHTGDSSWLTSTNQSPQLQIGLIHANKRQKNREMIAVLASKLLWCQHVVLVQFYVSDSTIFPCLKTVRCQCFWEWGQMLHSCQHWGLVPEAKWLTSKRHMVLKSVQELSTVLFSTEMLFRAEATFWMTQSKHLSSKEMSKDIS